MPYPTPLRTQLALAVLAMGLVVLFSNILVQYAINDWLTWGPSPTLSPSWSRNW